MIGNKTQQIQTTRINKIRKVLAPIFNKMPIYKVQILSLETNSAHMTISNNKTQKLIQIPKLNPMGLIVETVISRIM